MAQPPSSEGQPFATPSPPPQDYQHIEASPADFGGLIAQGGERLGQGLVTATKFYGELSAQQAVTNWQDKTNDVLTNYRKLQGQDRMDAMPGTIQALKDAEQEGQESLALPFSQAMFSNDVRRLRAYHEQTIGSLYDEAAKQWGLGVQTSRLTNNDTDLAQATLDGNWNRVAELTGQRAQLHVDTQKLHFGSQLDPEMERAARTQGLAESVQTQVMSLLPDHPAQAGALLKSYQGKIPAQEYERLSKMAEPALDKDYVRGLMAPYMGGASGGGSFKPGTPFTPSSLPRGVTLNEDAMVRTVAGEAGSEPLTGQRAVASVIMNRANGAGVSPRDIVFAPNQFEPWNGGAARQRLEAMDPSSPTYQDILNNVVRPVMAGSVSDPTGGATHFYAPAAQAQLGRQAPSWATGTPTVIGGHNFYKIGYGPGSAPHAEIAANAQQSPAEVAYPDESAMLQKVMRDFPPGPQQDRIVADVRNQMNVLRTMTATQRDDLVHSLPDIQAAALGGQDVAIPEAQIRHLLPPAQATREIENLGIAQSAGQVFKSVQWGSPSEVASAHQDLASGLGPISTMIKSRVARAAIGQPEQVSAATPEQESPEAYRLRTNILHQFEAQVAARQQALTSDPAAYVASNPVVQAKAAAIDPNNPATMDDLWRTSLAVQTQLGVPEYNQHIMTKAAATSTVGKLLNADPATADTGGQLAQMAQQTGTMWPRMFGDMVTLGKLPPAFQTLAQIPSPTARWDFQQMLKFTDEKGGATKLHEAAGNQNMRDIDTDIDTHLADFKRTAIVPGIYANLDGVANIRDSVRNLASYYTLQGMKPSEALTKATSGILNEKYDFDGTMRTPKGQMGAVQTAADQVIGALKPDDLLPLARDTQATPNVTAGGANNLSAAESALKLTPEEKFLYQTHLDHLEGKDGGAIRQPGGETSTLLQTSQEHDGKFYNVPTVWGGKEHTEDEAEEHAAQVGWDKWPSYPTRDAAEARYQQMHPYLERDIAGSSGLTSSQRQTITLEAAKQGRWIPNENDSGLYLVGQDTQGRMHLIQRSDGSRIELKFGNLPKGTPAAVTPPAMPMQ